MEYQDVLREAKKLGAANCSDAGVMALFCDTSLQTLVGAVSPKLVFNGAQSLNMSAQELARLANSDPRAVSELMWQ